MRVRVVDYVGNAGGGIRFTLSLLRGFLKARPHWTFEVVSDRRAFTTLCTAIHVSGMANAIRVHRVPLGPRGYFWKAFGRLPRSIRSAGGKILPHSDLLSWGVQVPHSAASDCDLLVFPWLHNHWVKALPVPTVATFHDTNIFDCAHSAATYNQNAERALTERWLDSRATVVTGSKATRDSMVRLFPGKVSDVSLIPVGDETLQLPSQPGPELRQHGLVPYAYLLCVANTSPHKNHEYLFRAISSWKAKMPLVLVGGGTDDITAGRAARGRVLRGTCNDLGLRLGKDVVCLGMVSDGLLGELTAFAWASCVPTTAEGGGSFPMQEAMSAGVPVIASDIPVLREHVERLGGTAMFAALGDHEEFANRLRQLDSDYAECQKQAIAARTELRLRSWPTVADEYAQLLESKTSSLAR